MDVIFTVCNRYTHANALALAESVNKHMPFATFYLCWVDDIPLPPVTGDVRILTVDEIGIPDWEGMCSRYFDFELVAACKPWFGRYLLGHLMKIDDVLTFLSPTTWLLRPIAKLPEEKDLMLKVNISKPLRKGKQLDDKWVLNVGMYHSGTWTVRKRDKIQQFFEWWSSRTIDRAKFDLCNGMCMDQLWLNYAPVWIPATTLNRSVSWHYGLHSITNHELLYKNEVFSVDGLPLVSAEFAGMQVFDPVWSVYRPRSGSGKPFNTLFEHYKRIVNNHKQNGLDTTGEGYGMRSGMKSPHPLLRRSVVLLDTLSKFIDKI